VGSEEFINCMEDYVETVGPVKRIVFDDASCYTSAKYLQAMEKLNFEQFQEP
jgi:hypothetical protein